MIALGNRRQDWIWRVGPRYLGCDEILDSAERWCAAHTGRAVPARIEMQLRLVV